MFQLSRSVQSSQLARFSTYKTKLQNNQYHFKAPQVESHDVWSVAVIHFTKLKNLLVHTHVHLLWAAIMLRLQQLKFHTSLVDATITDGISHVRNYSSFCSFFLFLWSLISLEFLYSQINKENSIPLEFHSIWYFIE